MKRLVLVLSLVACAGTARAQSGLSAEDWEALQEGEIEQGAYIGGALVGTFVGFGLGHAVQGRMDDGWTFLVGEGVSMGIFTYGLVDCVSKWDLDQTTEEDCATWAMIGGGIALLGFRIWELVDVWGAPPAHNERVRAARARAFNAYVAPTRGGGQAGFSLRF